MNGQPFGSLKDLCGEGGNAAQLMLCLLHLVLRHIIDSSMIPAKAFSPSVELQHFNTDLTCSACRQG